MTDDTDNTSDSLADKPIHGTVLAFDFGLKHIGVAAASTLTQSAHGVRTLSAKNGKPQWRDVDELVNEFGPAALVVGAPVNMDGSQSDMADQALAFAQKLRDKYSLPVASHDERLTSKIAKSEFPVAEAEGRASTEHELAACFIVESWMRQSLS